MIHSHLLKQNHKQSHLRAAYKTSMGWRELKDKELLKNAGITNKELNQLFTKDFSTRKAMHLLHHSFCNGDYYLGLFKRKS